ncbi:MAG: hypothetical protein HY650_15850 [Acidobacteria bacterium]|nr:hypothetical protein [Acidobacteriota bacterium]
MKQRCRHCGTRPGRRTCPALSGFLCGSCCADLRMIDLACPESCPHLREARQHAQARRTSAIVNRLAGDGKLALLRRISELEVLVFRIEKAVVELQRDRFRDLTDAEVLDGIESALATAGTAEKGIIYDHQAPTPRAQTVSDAILREIDEVKKKLEEHSEARFLNDKVLAELLEFIRAWIRLEMSADGQDYLRNIALQHPYPEEKSKLIVTP